MITVFSKIKTGVKKTFLILKTHILFLLLAGIIIYQNDRINELEKDLWTGFAFESTTEIVDRLADDMEDIKSKTDDIQNNTDDASSLSNDVDSRVSDLESRMDGVESNVSDMESNISNMESDIRRIKWDL